MLERFTALFFVQISGLLKAFYTVHHLKVETNITSNHLQQVTRFIGTTLIWFSYSSDEAYV